MVVGRGFSDGGDDGNLVVFGVDVVSGGNVCNVDI